MVLTPRRRPVTSRSFVSTAMPRLSRSALLLPIAALVVPLADLPGCTGVQENKQASALLSTADAYRKALRWGYWDAAVEFLHPAVRKDLDLSPLGNIRVTGIEVVRAATITPQNTAARLVRIDYVLEDEQRVKHLIDRQDWRWDDSRNGWLLYSGLPAF